MDINATLFGQMITFAIFVWFTMKFVWPMLSEALETRAKVIADGLAAAEKGKQSLLEAKASYDAEIKRARQEGEKIIEQARHEANTLLEQAKTEAITEKNQIIDSGHKHVEFEIKQAKNELQKDVTTLAIHVAEKVLNRELQSSDIDNLVQEEL